MDIRRNIYEIKNKKNLFTSKIKAIERNLTRLEEKKYYDYDDIEYERNKKCKSFI